MSGVAVRLHATGVGINRHVFRYFDAPLDEFLSNGLEQIRPDWLSRSRGGLPSAQGAATRHGGAMTRSRNAVPGARRPAAASWSGRISLALPEMPAW